MYEFDKVQVTSENLPEVTAYIEELLQKRAEFIKASAFDDGAFPDAYFVFDNRKRRAVDEVFVLDPDNSVADVEALKVYASKCDSTLLSSSILEWLNGYDEYRCSSVRRGRCPVNDSPICCAHCTINNYCVLQKDTPICTLVAIGDVVYREDCEEI